MGKFVPEHTDFGLSPYTGLTRESWLEAGIYMLEGIFKHIKTFDSPVVMPRKETQITYPHYYSDDKTKAAEIKAEIFEGLTRSMFIAAPMIHNIPDLTLNGYRLADYYKQQILDICTKGHPSYVGTYEEIKESTNSDQFRTFQQTVETCALVICLWASKEEIWDTYTKEEKDKIAAFLDSYARHATVPQNWRLFNMLDMAFLNMNGYDIDEEIMADHAQAILEYYAGDGWYRDGQSFDYYSCWAFNFYAPLWNQWYGNENMPYIAEQFEKNSNKLMESYADFFDEDGFTNMWGRSNIYRFAATSSFDGNMLLKHQTADAGLSRRIMSGSLMQFLGREDFLWDGIPTLGFYGQFAPLVQGYSCAESPFWLGKAFMCLHLPAEHPFWTAKENNGSWEKLSKGDVKETALDGPALCFTNHKSNGETILRSGKIVKDVGDKHGLWNYAKLSFNTKYPWEATPKFADRTSELFNVSENMVESQQYVLRDVTNGDISLANATFWSGLRDGVLYRRQFFNYRLDTEMHWIQGMYLADFPVEYGIMRVDKLKLHRRPVELTLGAYGFPDNGTQVVEKESSTEILGKHAKAVILKGKDACGKEKQLAMTIYDGWDFIDYVNSSESNPDSEKSIVVYAGAKRDKQYGGHERYVMISQVITKESHDDFTEDELFPIKNIIYTDAQQCGCFGPVRIEFKNGSVKNVDFSQLEGKLSL